MAFVIVWFVMTGGAGYIAPLDVPPSEMRCGIDGAVIGVQLDRVVNPSMVRWPDPNVAGQHCQVDISARVATLAQGEYHIATTIVGKAYAWNEPVDRYIGHDPHTSVVWMRDPNPTGLPLRPTNFRIPGER
jgi:hypothetical protein